MSPPPKPPRPAREPESERPLAPEDRELVLRVVHELEERMREEVQRSVREVESRLAEELRKVLHSEREQDRRLWDLDERVRRIAETRGGLAGEVSGRDVAREETKHTSARAAVLAIIISAATSGAVQGLVKAFEPVRPAPAPTHQAP